MNWYLDKDNDGYHAPDSPRSQPNNPGYPGDGWKQGTSLGEDCDDGNEKYKFDSLNIGLMVNNSKEVGIGGDLLSGDLAFQDIHNIIDSSSMNSYEKYKAHVQIDSDEVLDKYFTDEQYFESMRDFAEWTTFNDELVNEMINRFKQNISSSYYSSNNLTQSMLGSSGYNSFKNSLIQLLKDKIVQVSTNTPCITINDLGGPNFDTNGGLFAWNGSHSSILDVSNLTINCDKFSMTATLKMYDHFGLDNTDLYPSGNTNNGLNEYISRNSFGMRSWFILQRVKGYKPFVNEISTTFNLSDESF